MIVAKIQKDCVLCQVYVAWRFDNQRAMHSMITVPYLKEKRPGRVVYHSRPFNAEVKNMSNYTDTPHKHLHGG